MSYAWSLPLDLPVGPGLRSELLMPERTRVVIPTYKDWDGARETIESLMECRPRPGEIVVVNDNEERGAPSWLKTMPVRLVDYTGNRGPAYARNAGATLRTDKRIDWLYFTDTGCRRDPSFFATLAVQHARMDPTCSAVAGPVSGVSTSIESTPINWYMTEEAILAPPFDAHGPQAIVTANAAVCRRAFRAARGFDHSYRWAAGEDLDLGVRLRRLGSIGWASDAVVYHPFPESIEDFRRRFIRYGTGTAHLEHRLKLGNLRPGVFSAHHGSLQHLADLHIAAMLEGYERHRSRIASPRLVTLSHGGLASRGKTHCLRRDEQFSHRPLELGTNR